MTDMKTLLLSLTTERDALTRAIDALQPLVMREPKAAPETTHGGYRRGQPAAMKKKWADPKFRERMSAAMRAGHTRRRAQVLDASTNGNHAEPDGNVAAIASQLNRGEH